MDGGKERRAGKKGVRRGGGEQEKVGGERVENEGRGW